MTDISEIDPGLGRSVDQFIIDAERAHNIINGTGTQGVLVEDGSIIPTLRKAMLDNLYYKTPPIPWKVGIQVREFNQLYSFVAENGDISWWYSPGATQSSPVTMMESPVGDVRFRVFLDTGSIANLYAPINSPLFTGNPRGPTPAKGDDSPSLATTKFVAAAIEAAISGGSSGSGNFTNLSVTNQSNLNKLDVAGQANFKAGIDATNSAMLLNTLRMMGETGKIDFDFVHPDYVGKLRTILTPHRVETSDLKADNLTVTQTVVIGDPVNPSAAGNALTVHGNVDMDYLHLTGNSKRPLTDPQLIVDGNAVIKNLSVTGTLSGASVNVDGVDIRPASVTTDQIDAKRVNVSEKLTVSGATEVKDLKITGTVTGLDFPPSNVDGLDIKPKSVVTTNSSNLGATTTVKDLVVTGTTTGITATVNGLDITPRSVSTTQGMSVGTNLTVAAETRLKNLSAQQISMPVASNVIGSTTFPLPTAYNIQNYTLTSSTTITAPTTWPTQGMNFVIYFEQSAQGGKAVTFDSGTFIQLNDDMVNTAPNSVTIVQLIYRGSGTKIDLIITQRP